MSSLTLHTLAPASGSRVKKFRIGRGAGSGRGKTAGRGTKGQRSRTGGRRALKLKGMKQMLLSFPKNRGFQSHRVRPVAISLKKLEAPYPDGAAITLETLRASGLVPRSAQSVKIIGADPITKKFTIEGVSFSAGARAALHL